MDQLPDEINFHNLKVGDTVGLLYTNSGTLHLFINGAHMVTLPCTVPMGVYGLVDLYGQCVKVSLRPLTLWNGGSPLHVMADKSALDQQRKQLAGKLSMSTCCLDLYIALELSFMYMYTVVLLLDSTCTYSKHFLFQLH